MTPMTPHASERSPDTIVLVHGFWVTPRSWEHWISYYAAKGYRVLAPAYPGFEVEVEALNADPTPVERLTVPAIIAHLESIVGALGAPPILMGHSAGGTFVQILLDHGFGAAGVTFNSAPTEGGEVFEGRSHLLPAQRGWEEIADYALSWAERHVVSLAERGA